MKTKLVILLFCLYSLSSLACTTAVVSGKYTANGKPLLWKVRDTDFLENKMHYFKNSKQHFIALVNTIDTLNTQVWAGSNDAGFAIMNSASFNVNLEKSTKGLQDQEGYIMKKALETCQSLKDFEKLLDKLDKPMGLAAHFGVIDAQGGAAFYEVNNLNYTKFDANDPSIAPNGYILRTNFSYTGKKDIGYGFIRYQTAQDLWLQADATHQINPQTCMQNFSRSFEHSVLKTNFRTQYESYSKKSQTFVNSGDLITRHGTSSAITIEGVSPKMSPDMSTLWVQIAYPNTCVTVPIWVKGENNFPAILQANDSNKVLLSDWTMELKDKCYPIKRSAGYKYLCITQLVNKEKTGFLQQIEAFEQALFQQTLKLQKEWDQQSPSLKELKSFYTQYNAKVTQFYQTLLP